MGFVGYYTALLCLCTMYKTIEQSFNIYSKWLKRCINILLHTNIYTINYMIIQPKCLFSIYLIYGQINEHFLKGITSQYKYIGIYV